MSKKEKNIWSTIFWVVIVIALIMLTLGWFIDNSKVTAKAVKPIVNDKKPDELRNLQQRRKELNARLSKIQGSISFIEAIKTKILKTEKRIYRGARSVIALFIVLINIFIIAINHWNFDLGAQLNVNEALLLGYSFFAFISYGTPTQFMKAMKVKIGNYLKKNHIQTIEELVQLQEEAKMLAMEIQNIEPEIAKFEVINQPQHAEAIHAK